MCLSHAEQNRADLRPRPRKYRRPRSCRAIATAGSTFKTLHYHAQEQDSPCRVLRLECTMPSLAADREPWHKSDSSIAPVPGSARAAAQTATCHDYWHPISIACPMAGSVVRAVSWSHPSLFLSEAVEWNVIQRYALYGSRRRGQAAHGLQGMRQPRPGLIWAAVSAALCYHVQHASDSMKAALRTTGSFSYRG